MGEEADPARLYAIQGELDASGIYLDEEVERFKAFYFKPKRRQSALDHRAMNAALDPAVSRFTARRDDHEEEVEDWRGKAQAFLNLYGFLSQVIPYQDSDLERLYVFLRHLAAKLPRRNSGPAYRFDDEVRLEYYRLQEDQRGRHPVAGWRAPPRRPHGGRQRLGTAAARAAVATHRHRERALRHGLQPGRSALLRPDCRSGRGQRRSAAGSRGQPGRQVRAGVQEPAGESVRRAHGAERGGLRSVHERCVLPEDRDRLDGAASVSAAKERRRPRRSGAHRIGCPAAPPADRRAATSGALPDLRAAGPAQGRSGRIQRPPAVRRP